MVWREGKAPDDGPAFAPELTADLLDYGYGILALALELRDSAKAGLAIEYSDGFRVAAESIESAIRRGHAADRDRGRHLVVAAAAFQLGGFAARAFSMLPVAVLASNLSSVERALALLLRRDLDLLRVQIIEALSDPLRADEVVAQRLGDAKDAFDPEDAAVIALETAYYRALGFADTALNWGDRRVFQEASDLFGGIVESAAAIGNLTLWWVATLTVQVVDDLYVNSLHVRLPETPSSPSQVDWSRLRSDFIALVGSRRPPQLDLWPSQLAAASRAADPADDLVVALPTSAGKTRIAELCILCALSQGLRVVYVTPLRALSAQVEGVLARTFVPLGATVTSLYGSSGALADAETLVSAAIVVATPEKLDFALRQDASVLDDVSLVVFDEGHMIGLGSREIRYEVLIQRLLRRSDAKERRIVCLSAMFNPDDPNFRDFEKWLRSDEEGDAIHVQWRPTRQRIATLDWYERSGAARLSFLDGEKPFVPRFLEAAPKRGRRHHPFPHDERELCIASANAFAKDGHSVLVYSPQRSHVEPLVTEFLRIAKQGYLEAIPRPDPSDLAVAVAVGREWLGSAHSAVVALSLGIGTHHGALPRPFLSVVEELIHSRRLPVVVASPTLAQGIDLACSVLIFRALHRFDSTKAAMAPISAAEFSNVLGRVGRAYVDLDGVAVLPTFDANKRSWRQDAFHELIAGSSRQRLLSGLALLVEQVCWLLSSRLGVQSDRLLEHVANARDLWADARLSKEPDPGEDDERRTFDDYVADLDVAVLSLVEDLDVNSRRLGDLLDDLLRNSLWRRTLARVDPSLLTLQRELLLSRAEWLWATTTGPQRRGCFFAGLGRKPGLFLWDRLDDLVDLLTGAQSAIVSADAETAAKQLVAFAGIVSKEPFFWPTVPPEDWPSVLEGWIAGVPFAKLLEGRGALSAQRLQAFVQDTVVFRLVWAAEAVRVQARSREHPRADDLGDGPAFVLTHGVPTVSAALLCQFGMPSRVGALWAATELQGKFTSAAEFRVFLRKHRATLAQRDFWPSEDLHLLWRRSMSTGGKHQPSPWTRSERVEHVAWQSPPPDSKQRLRLVPSGDRTGWVCGPDLAPLGTAHTTFDLDRGCIDAYALGKGELRIDYFGPQ